MTASSENGAPEPWPYVPADESGWPTATECADSGEFAKALCEAKLEVRKKRTDAEIDRAKAERAVDLAVEQAYYQAVIDLAKGGLDRTRASAETVQKAAATIVTLYTGVLALAFAAGSHPLPFRALFAALLLGLAVALSTAYLAYLPDPDRPDPENGGGPSDLDPSDSRVRTFVLWSRRAALERSYPLRASVLALAAALFFLPAPFIQKGAAQTPAPKINWPSTPTQVNDPELQKILYTAQVKEAADARNAPVADEGNETFWRVVFGIALLIVLVVPLFRRPSAHNRLIALLGFVLIALLFAVGIVAWGAGHYAAKTNTVMLLQPP
jgi:hypothetical protein